MWKGATFMKRILGFLTLLFLLFTSGCNQQPEGESAISEESTVSEESTFEYYKGGLRMYPSPSNAMRRRGESCRIVR